MKKSKRLRRDGQSRYRSYLSIGPLLNLQAQGLRDTLKAEFLPQWDLQERGATEAVLSKRSLLVDIGMSQIELADLEQVPVFLERLRKVIAEEPDKVLEIVQAFGLNGSKPEREKAARRATALGLYRADDPGEPVAFWGVALLVGAAILIAGCCNETDTECDTDTDTDGDTDGDMEP
jgi:hypothetical protein